MDYFLISLTKITKKEEMKTFLDSFLTETEKVMFAKRLATAFLLSQNYPEEKIAEILSVTIPTVSRLRLVLKEKLPGYQAAFNLIRKEQGIEEFKAFLGEIFKKIDHPFPNPYR